jgi:hypothetical protein
MMLAEKFAEVVARVDELGLAATPPSSLAEALRDAADADPRKETDIDTVDGTVAANIAFLHQPRRIRLGALVCTDPAAVDDDGDGHSGCGDDCDDDDDNIYPGAPRSATRTTTTATACGTTTPVPAVRDQAAAAPRDRRRRVLLRRRTRAEAEADCVDQGGHLVSLHAQAVQDFVADEAFAIQDSDWWIGLSDLQDEGTFVWSDATPSTT